ncbi:hypothetical protein [Paenibacillus elgii]|uniref:hypothetical protein n=1 Tax=Paenibacillus elgii TaxID=189691 RepID=UPI0030DBB609
MAADRGEREIGARQTLQPNSHVIAIRLFWEHHTEEFNDKTPTKHRQNTDKTPTKHRQNTDKTPTKHRQNTDKTPTKHRQRSEHLNQNSCYRSYCSEEGES